MKNEYTKLRKFYAWVGFMVTVIAFAVLLAVVIHFWSNAIVNHSIKVVPEINSNLA